MKITSEKQLITAGKMPVARMVRMNMSGIWQLNNFTAQLAASLLAAANPLLLVLPAKRAVLRLLKNLQRLLLLAKNNKI